MPAMSSSRALDLGGGPSVVEAIGVDPAAVDAVAWIGREESVVVVIGELDAAALEQRYGGGGHGEPHTHREVAYWGPNPDASPVPPVSGLLAPPLLVPSFVAVVDGMVLGATTAELLEAMIDATLDGTGLSSQSLLLGSVERAALPGVTSVTLLQVDSAEQHRRAMQAVEEWRTYTPDAHTPVEPPTPEELDALASQAVLEPYRAVAFGWGPPPDGAASQQRELVLVFVNADAATAATNAERFPQIVEGGRSVQNRALWKDQGIGPVRQSSSDDVFTVVVLDAVPHAIESSIMRNDILFASAPS